MKIDFNIAVQEDVQIIMKITKDVVKNMIEVNNIDQWDETYPNADVFINDVQQGNLFVAKIEGEIVGYICINDEETEEYKKVAWNAKSDYLLIHRIGVNPIKTGNGVGSKLISYGEKIAIERGAKWMKIDTNSSNALMNNLIKKMGYQYVGDMQLKPNKPIWHAYDKRIY